MWTAYLYFALSTGVALARLCHRAVAVLSIAARRVTMIAIGFFSRFVVGSLELTMCHKPRKARLAMIDKTRPKRS